MTGLNYDYKTGRDKRNEPEKGSFPLPEGTWLPVSIAAHIAGISKQMARIKINNNLVKCLEFPTGPVLVKLEDLFQRKEK